jgi:D-arabinose 1-dehydrogenase-like Zn-dependent alcohol dehydrogenase
LDTVTHAPDPKSLPINDYLALLRPKGRISLVGIVPQPLTVETGPLISSNKGVSGSPIGSPSDLKELLELVAAKGIKPWVQVYGFSDINKALVDFKKGLPKYRIVLSNVETTSRI